MLEIDIPTIVFEIINFLALTVLLYFLLFRRVVQSVRNRAEEKQRLLQEAHQEREEAQRLRMEWESLLDGVDEKVAEIVSKAHENMDEERKKVIQSARNEARRILEGARSEAEQLQKRETEEYAQQILDVIMEICGNIIGQIAPAEAHEKLFHNLSDRIWELGRKEMDLVEIIRRSYDERSPTIDVETALNLSSDLTRELAQTLSALIDRDVDLELIINPELILGFRVRLGDVVIDNSITHELLQMQEKTAEVLQERLLHE